MIRLLLYPALLSLALAASAQAANEQFPLEITYTGSGSLAETRTIDCYDEGGEFHEGVVHTWNSNVQWTTVYEPLFALPPGGKRLLPSGNQLGVGEWDSHELTGSYTAAGQPCQQPGGGTLGEVNGVNQPNTTPYMPAFGILDGTNIEFRLAPTQYPGETDRERMFTNNYTGYGTSNWDAANSAPPFRSENAVASLTGIFTLSLGQLRDLTEGRKEAIDVAVSTSTLPLFTPLQPDNGTIIPTLAGNVRIIATCGQRTKTGTGYKQLDGRVKKALKKLYKELDRQKACYRYVIGYRSSAKQKQLYDRWHAIADSQGPNDNRTDAQVCAAVTNAGFAQCPKGRSANGVAKGGPAKPGSSRHEFGEAVDLTVRWPKKNLKDLDKYQAAARKAGLCGPPKGDDVHIELPYSKGKGKPVKCHFPPGPAP